MRISLQALTVPVLAALLVCGGCAQENPEIAETSRVAPVAAPTGVVFSPTPISSAPIAPPKPRRVAPRAVEAPPVPVDDSARGEVTRVESLITNAQSKTELLQIEMAMRANLNKVSDRNLMRMFAFLKNAAATAPVGAPDTMRIAQQQIGMAYSAASDYDNPQPFHSQISPETRAKYRVESTP